MTKFSVAGAARKKLVQKLSDLTGERAVYQGMPSMAFKVGAYTMCLAPLFIKWFPDVYVKEGTAVTKVRGRWTAEEYQSRCVRK